MAINRDDFEEAIVNIGRVTKVVKGGRRFRFTALVVVGDKNGTIGVGTGKAKEVPDAIKKALDDAFKSLVKVNLNGSTINHDIEHKYNASRILLKPASEGTGLIAGAITLILGSIVIALAWFTSRPMMSLTIIGVGVIIGLLLSKMGKKDVVASTPPPSRNTPNNTIVEEEEEPQSTPPSRGTPPPRR